MGRQFFFLSQTSHEPICFQNYCIYSNKVVHNSRQDGGVRNRIIIDEMVPGHSPFRFQQVTISSVTFFQFTGVKVDGEEGQGDVLHSFVKFCNDSCYLLFYSLSCPFQSSSLWIPQFFIISFVLTPLPLPHFSLPLFPL